MIQFHTLNLNEVQLHYAEATGPEPALVIVHGLSGSHAEFLHLIPELTKYSHVYVLDLRGHGLSSRATNGYKVADYARDVAGFIRQVVGQPVVLLGHSLGGVVAIWLAANEPDLFRGLILEDPPLYILQLPRFAKTGFHPYFTHLHDFLGRYHADGALLEEMERYVGQTGIEGDPSMIDVVGPEAVRERAMQLHHLDPATLDPVLEATLLDSVEPDDLLVQIRCPVHLLAAQSALGAAMEVEDVQRAISRMPHCTHSMIDGAGHDIHLTQPRAFVREVQGFLTSVRQQVA